ncbi:sulfite reductase [NADPH] flavoprotein alpha-component [Haloferula helveola]|uniref:Sulfite reductase [NADPH] flavoprotein alpha-component n=1 Tax=Haloferula helveola TaxID=490095 RepID=A0ABN6H915_9BACT|nr:sulfite reductase [NADPH] flavoprotein alpha-component [Haloferula helveola]
MLPEHAPFSPEQRSAAASLLQGLTPGQRLWLAGYLSAESGSETAAATPSASPLLVLYGTESGNAEALADLTAKQAKKRGFKPSVKNMADLSPADLAKAGKLLVIVSTWGDGDPPESATGFYNGLMQEKVDLSGVSFSVCALGDTSYEQFCKTGKDIDARLEALGAKRTTPRKDCDVDYDEDHAAWLDEALSSFGPAVAAPAAPAVAIPVAGEAFGKKNPFPSEMLEKVLLNGEGSQKETWHYELSLEGSGMSYLPGDALAVVPLNAPDMVEGVLKAAKLKGTEKVSLKGGDEKVLADALREDFEITVLSKAVLKKLQAVAKSERLEGLLADDAKDQLKDYLWGRWVADALAEFAPKGVSADELVGILRKLPPRLYSIASSPLAHPDEVHLTVASVRYEAHGLQRKGVASTFLADLVETGQQVRVYTHVNKNFRLPDSDDTPIIMVGPGTGIAPFRAFVEHRAETGAKGDSWLIFGDQRYTYDFLYQLEWQDHLSNGALNRLDVAFSRDQPEKVYVQDKMRENAAELFAWLEKGAHFYVCGDASRMAHDVNEALIGIIEAEGKRSREEAEAYVEGLRKSKRYQRDVY